MKISVFSQLKKNRISHIRKLLNSLSFLNDRQTKLNKKLKCGYYVPTVGKEPCQVLQYIKSDF